MSASALLLALVGPAIVPLVQAHMIMSFPIPYNHDTAPFVQVNPLSGDHYPFPCQNRTGIEVRTTVEAGTATLVQFTGGAQHGGGSCQFSISYDDPSVGGWTPSAEFKTVYTIIGGCPAHFTDESENLPSAQPDQQGRANSKKCGNDFGIDCIRQFLVPLPRFLKNGPATFAWTWFNKVGNREMYMTCAPITITGGTEDENEIKQLPDIFVANVPYSAEGDCVTGTASDYMVLNIPNPGTNGRVIENPGEPRIKPSNYCPNIPPASLVPSFVADSRTIPGSGGGASPTYEKNTTTSPKTTTTQYTTSTYSSYSGSTAMTQTAKAITPETQKNTRIPASSVLGQGQAPPAETGASGTATCSENGKYVCIDSNTFGICNWGTLVPEKVAPGTKCVDGKMVPVTRRKRMSGAWGSASERLTAV